MQQALTAFTPQLRRLPPKNLAVNPMVPRARSASSEPIGNLPSSQGFAALLAAYRASGGTARGNDVARLLQEYQIGTFVSLAKLIAADEVFTFEWRSTLWIPMFQFEPGNLSTKRAAQLVLAELGSMFNGWERATWFARPNSWLNSRRPVDLIDTELAEVSAAARADRFIAVG